MLEMTKDEVESIRRERLLELIEYAGGMPHLALMINEDVHKIQSWRRKGHITPKGVVSVENNPKLRDAGFTTEYLRVV